MKTNRSLHIATLAVYLAIALLVRSTSRGAEIESGGASAPSTMTAPKDYIFPVAPLALHAPTNVPLICPECAAAGKKSTVTEGATTSTLAYNVTGYDENGNQIPPSDRNTTTTRYVCSEGHRFERNYADAAAPRNTSALKPYFIAGNQGQTNGWYPLRVEKKVDSSFIGINFSVSLQGTVAIQPGYAKSIMVGEARITKASVLDLIATLKKVRDNTLKALRFSYDSTVENAKNASRAAKEKPMDYSGLTIIIETDIEAQRADIDAKIAELQKLADALAQEGSK